MEGGNQDIQRTFFTQLQLEDKGHNFFKVFHDKINDAQSEIKNTVTVNTSDIAAKAHEEKEPSRKDLEQAIKKRGSKHSNGIIITEELREELDSAIASTQEAYVAVKSEALTDDPSFGAPTLTATFEDQLAEKVDRAKEKEEENKLSPKVSVMKPILRFLQLLCENHNRDLQNLLRDQKSNKNKYNLISETLLLLDVICGSTTGGLGLLGLYINENNVMLINQILETLTEYCQGPCYENQACIAMHESNGLGIITALILNDINPLGKVRMDLVLELRNNASKLLLAIMESRSSDPENVADKIIFNMNPKQLIDAACKAYHQQMLDEDGEEEDDPNNDDETVSPKEVGHNIYILCHQLAFYNKEIGHLLKTGSTDPKVSEALNYYKTHTAQIEVVRQDRTLEQVTFSTCPLK